MKNKSIILIAIVIIGCILMSIIELFIEPSYLVKSLSKIIIFFIIPVIILKIFKIDIECFSLVNNKKDIIKSLLLGITSFLFIMVVYLIVKNIYSFSDIVKNISCDQHVSSSNFIYISLYISFGNSFVEEFLFRNIAFLKLSNYLAKKKAYLFSSILFGLYHIPMVGGALSKPLMVLALVGLIIGGLIMNRLDDKNNNIYNSWFFHMFVDFALMLIWFVNI